MKIFRYISVLIFCSVIFFSCGNDEGKVIPRRKLAEIYADMFMTDQWIANNPSVRRIADTSLVYEPVFQKYGYTSDDYRRSMEVYLDDPERYSRILRTTVSILDKRLVNLKKRQAELEIVMAQRERLEQMKIEIELEIEKLFPYLFLEPYVHYYDSLAVEQDSIQMVYRLKNIERSDTVFDGVRIIINKDSLMVADSIPVLDTVAVVSEEEVVKPVVNSFERKKLTLIE